MKHKRKRRRSEQPVTRRWLGARLDRLKQDLTGAIVNAAPEPVVVHSPQYQRLVELAEESRTA